MNEAAMQKIEQAIAQSTEVNTPRSVLNVGSPPTGNGTGRDRGGATQGLPSNRAPVGQTQVSSEIEALLEARQGTHGDFTDNARVMQGLKRVLWNEKGWDKLTDVQREALELIMTKVGRIISGNPNEPDHWTDIAGYAKLAAQRLAR